MDKEWVYRVNEEKQDLKIKIEKLMKFLEENPDHEDRDLLTEQQSVMVRYYEILLERLVRAGA
jgi:hypothetical protein